MKKFLAAMCLFLLALPILARADTNIDNCTILNTTGETYLLTANATKETSCMRFADSNIILDCQNYSISSNVTVVDFTGFDYVSNITIKNCNIECLTNDPFYQGIYFEGYDSLFKNNTLTNCYNGMQFDSNYVNETNNTIINNTFIDNNVSIVFNIEDSGFYYFDNFIYDNHIVNGVLFQYSGPDILFNNWNISTGGNFWTEWAANCTCNDGICAEPYVIDENNTDYLPLCIAEQGECVPSWNCTDWGECEQGYQTRECTDSNQCGDNRTKPAESQACEMPLPNATFNITSNCCPISAFFCEGNTTLVQMWNTSQGYSYAYVACPNGCDNVTDSCAPLPYQQSLWIILVIVIIAVIIILIAWRLLR